MKALKVLDKIADSIAIAFVLFILIYGFFFLAIAFIFSLTYLIGGYELDIETCMFVWIVCSTISYLILTTSTITIFLTKVKKESK